MPDRATIAQQAAAGLRDFAARQADCPAMVGFDGFVDSIIAVVDKRHDQKRYTPVATIEQFGRKILNAAGHSSNYELVTTLTKLGGNGPIMANALSAAGLPVTYIGALGYPTLHPVFEELAKRANVMSFTEPGATDALEFNDGKLLLGKYEMLGDVNIDRLLEVIGKDQFHAVVAQSRFMAMVNWTMLTQMESIWLYMIERILAQEAKSGPRRLVFVDLADPEKRTAEDLRHALQLCSRFTEVADVTLGLNLKESTQVAQVLDVPVEADPATCIERTAVGIREKLDLTTVVIHPRNGAAAASRIDGNIQSAQFTGPFVKEPKLSTGAGDNFNAGFCLGQLAGLSLDQCLCTGTATSGFYVRNAGSPSLEDLAAFCENLPDPE